jgi:tRNA-2-methylthio-N6-dimethylallyladenosine synthase
MNVADSERAATRLRAEGYELCDSPEAANFVILNTCSIREKAERKVFHRIDDIRRARAGSLPIIGLMGCVAQLEGEACEEHDRREHEQPKENDQDFPHGLLKLIRAATPFQRQRFGGED